MEGGKGGRRAAREAAAVFLLLCSLAQNLTAFSLRNLHKTVQAEQDVTEAAELEARKGIILFNGEELEPLSGSEAENEGMEDFDQPDDAVTLEQLENVAAWRRLNTSLHCGDIGMKLKAFGAAAADLQVDRGNAAPYPLIQVPKACDYTIQQSAQGLVLIVPFNGCHMIQENGEYILPLLWRNTPVKLVCPVLASAESEDQSRDAFLQQQSAASDRSKRRKRRSLSIYDYWNPYYPYLYYYYAQSMSQKPNAAVAAPAVASPAMQNPTPMMTAYNPYQQYYYYPQFAQYSNPAFSSQNPIGPGSNAQQNPSFPQKSPSKSPVGQLAPGTPDNSGVYYYPIIQYFYGQNPNEPTTTTKAPTTTKPCGTTTKSPCAAGKCTTTKNPCTAYKCSTTKSPCTASTCHKKTTTTVGICLPGFGCPFRSFEEQPFKPVVSYSRARTFPEVEKYVPEESFKSPAPQVRAHPGYQWEHIPRVSSSWSKDNQFQWKG